MANVVDESTVVGQAMLSAKDFVTQAALRGGKGEAEATALGNEASTVVKESAIRAKALWDQAAETAEKTAREKAITAGKSEAEAIAEGEVARAKVQANAGAVVESAATGAHKAIAAGKDAAAANIAADFAAAETMPEMDATAKKEEYKLLEQSFILHKAVRERDHEALKRHVSELPKELVYGDKKVMITIDDRRVLNKETPLILAAKKGDLDSAKILLDAGADWTLRNRAGWNALQVAHLNGSKKIVEIILSNYCKFLWKKWRNVSVDVTDWMKDRIDFYAEIQFKFEHRISCLSRFTPSDTFKIWKLKSNLRVDFTCVGIKGFKIRRSRVSLIFFGEGAGHIVGGADVFILLHDSKQFMKITDNSDLPEFVKKDIRETMTAISAASLFRCGIDLTELGDPQPKLSCFGRNPKRESFGGWKVTDVFCLEKIDVVTTLMDVNQDGGGMDADPKVKRARKKVVLWSDRNFELQTKQFVALLDKIATKGVGFAGLKKLLEKLPNDRLPVKVSVPMSLGTKLLAEVKKFQLKGSGQPYSSPSRSIEGAFSIPDGYTLIQ